MAVLKVVSEQGLRDCWVGAGFVRNAVWDYLHGFGRTPLNDIDVVYYDKSRDSANEDRLIESRLAGLMPECNWSVRNQARMHLRNKHAPYKNCRDAISYWPETATAIAVRMDENEELEVFAAYGLDDLFNLRVKPTPKVSMSVYRKRLQNKQWPQTWHKLGIEDL